MRTAVFLSFATLCNVFAGSAHAGDANGIDAKQAESLAKSKGCTACHSVDTKLVGPSYKDVAAKYRDVADAQAVLMKKIKNGGSGVWGQIPMPPHPDISDADLKIIVNWVLSLE